MRINFLLQPLGFPLKALRCGSFVLSSGSGSGGTHTIRTLRGLYETAGQTVSDNRSRPARPNGLQSINWHGHREAIRRNPGRRRTTRGIIMNEKALHTLEFDKIIEQLTTYASSPWARSSAGNCVPSSDISEITHMQTETHDALNVCSNGTDLFWRSKGYPRFPETSGNRQFSEHPGTAPGRRAS